MILAPVFRGFNEPLADSIALSGKGETTQKDTVEGNNSTHGSEEAERAEDELYPSQALHR